MRAAVGAAIVLALALSGSGCATLLTGTHQSVHFVTDPPGATATLDTGAHVVTPGSLAVDRRRHHTVKFTRPGYQAKTMGIERRVRGLVLGDVFTGIVPGLVVDFLAGGAFGLPDEIHVKLVEAPAPVPAPVKTAPSATATAAVKDTPPSGHPPPLVQAPAKPPGKPPGH